MTGVTMPETKATKTLYWHRELPPVDAEIVGEHTVEASSGRVPGTISHREALCDHRYQALTPQNRRRTAQESARLAKDCARIIGASRAARNDDYRSEAWLCGRFTHALVQKTQPRD